MSHIQPAPNAAALAEAVGCRATPPGATPPGATPPGATPPGATGPACCTGATPAGHRR